MLGVKKLLILCLLKTDAFYDNLCPLQFQSSHLNHSKVYPCECLFLSGIYDNYLLLCALSALIDQV